MSHKKGTNVLLRSPYSLQPANSIAARVMGLGDPTSALSLRTKVKELKKAIKKATDDQTRKRLEEEHGKTLLALKQGLQPSMDSKAEAKARRQLERAKWMRENGYR